MATKIEVQMNLTRLSIGELRALAGDVAKLIAKDEAKLQAKRRADAIEQIYAVAHGLGMPLATILLVGKSRPKNERRPPQRYQDPANASNTWGGAGPRPKWLQAALAAGVSLERLRT